MLLEPANEAKVIEVAVFAWYCNTGLSDCLEADDTRVRTLRLLIRYLLKRFLEDFLSQVSIIRHEGRVAKEEALTYLSAAGHGEGGTARGKKTAELPNFFPSIPAPTLLFGSLKSFSIHLLDMRQA